MQYSHLHRSAHLCCRHRDLPRSILSGYGDLRCGNLSGFSDLQGCLDLPRLPDLSWDRNLRQHGNMYEYQFLSGYAHLRRYDHV